MRFLPVLLLFCLGCEPLADELGRREPTPVRRKAGAVDPADPAPARLKVMSWNIKFGAGRIDFWFDKWGDRVEMGRGEVEANLAGIYRLIDEVRPDILLVQEIEVNSRRSAHVEMVNGILANTHLNYASYMPTWKSRYVPSEGLGRIDMGNAIFSTYPMVFAERIPMVERGDQDAATRYFYIHRQVGRAVIQAGARQVAALVLHTEAYDRDGTKQKQLAQIAGLLADEPLPFVVGGDFNALPPTATRTHGFNDEHPSALGTGFEQPPYDLTEMAPFFDGYRSAIDLPRFGTTEAEQRPYYTHSVIGRHQIGARGQPGFWDRTLDYLFVRPPGDWVPGSTDVLQEPGRLGIGSDPMLLSDHCPVVGVWEMGP
jgi:endonuclease/exonuclease/phosphatase family metal-dependent hydrolase